MFEKINFIKKILFIIFFITAITLPLFAYAGNFGQDKLDQTLTKSKITMNKDLPTSIGNIIKAVLTLAGTIFLVLTVYGGISWMIASGNSEKIEKAKNILIAAVIGGAITASAYAITFFVFSQIVGS